MSDLHHSHSKLWRLFSIVISAILIVSFIVPITAISAYAIDVPQPLYPTNYANTTSVTDPPLGVPSFTWSGVVGANVYHLQVDSEIAFNQPIFLDITTRNTSFTPSSSGHLFADGEWYWRLRVEDPAPVGDWSPIMRFTKTWATPSNKPALISPAEGAPIAFFDDPLFSWTRVVGAARYRFQIATTQWGFDSPVLSIDTLSVSYQPNNRLTNGLYYWRVVPMDTVDHLGTPSDVRSFTLAYGTYLMHMNPDPMVPTLLQPDDDTFPTFTPTFHWTAIKGAEHYRLEYTSDETCDFSVGTSLETRQTYYTPTDTFPNDFRYCWRVRVESGPAVGDWSDTWHFQKRWYLQPVLLTPTQLYQTGLYPMYSWTPVPGASSYHIEISTKPDFSVIVDQGYTSNTSYTPRYYIGTAYYYWRITPIDGGGKLGLANDPPFEFQSYYTSTAPILVHPQYYYLPNNYGQFTMNPIEDRTVAYPIFQWHQVMNPAPNGGIYASPYRIQVDDYPPYFTDPVWEYDTENTSATPTILDYFNPQIGQDYWWRVCPLEYVGEIWRCKENPSSGLAWWSQIWKARFSEDLALTPTDGAEPPELLRPAHGQEVIETIPLLEWWPLQGATQYQVEISRDESFLTSEISETVDIPAYAPNVILAQRIRDRTDYGTFYWRVRALVTGVWRVWSEPWRFQIASQSEWRYTRTAGNPDNKLLIGDDFAGDVDSSYDLTTLYVSQSAADWWLGFNTTVTLTNMTYAFYIDIDHIDGSGAPTPPPFRNYAVTTIPAHQPEYAIYVDNIGGVIDAQNTWVFTWDQAHNVWDYGQRFNNIGGVVYTSSGYVELRVPNGAIGMSQLTNSASIMLFSVNTSTNAIVDSVPSDPQVPGNSQLSRFSAVSDHMNLISPSNTVTGDPTTIPSILPFFWDWPTGDNPSTPFKGSHIEVHLDASYTNRVADLTITSNTSYFSENNATLLNDIVGDNIYYWRIQPIYGSPGQSDNFGSWTGGWSFHRLGFTPQNLNTSVNFATPTFSWDMAEGAQTYRLQVSTDPNFGSLVVNIATPMNSYTPQDTLAEGSYYWRVQIYRYGNIGNDWSEVNEFSLSLPTPNGLTPNNTVIHYTPTYCWDPIVMFDNEEPPQPVLTAWRYHIQVSQDPNFSNTYDSIDTYNNCWTPTMGYNDGTYYWRVAMFDGNSRMGSYSPPATFTKQYPITTLISPINEPVPFTPTYIWTPVDGAATYLFEVSLFQSFFPLYDSVETINTQFTPTFIYATDRTYYWRVAIRDRSGRLGPFTDARIIIGDVYPVFLPIMRK